MCARESRANSVTVSYGGVHYFSAVFSRVSEMLDGTQLVIQGPSGSSFTGGAHLKWRSFVFTCSFNFIHQSNNLHEKKGKK